MPMYSAAAGVAKFRSVNSYSLLQVPAGALTCFKVDRGLAANYLRQRIWRVLLRRGFWSGAASLQVWEFRNNELPHLIPLTTATD